MSRFALPLLLAAVAVPALAAPARAQGTAPPVPPAPATTAAPAGDPAPAPAPPVDDLVAEAVAHNPRLAALRSGVEAAERLERPAAALPDPTVEGSLQNAGVDRWTVGEMEMSNVAAEFRQELPLPAKRAAARAVAVAETGRSRAALVHAERQLVHDVRSSYAELYALDRELETIHAARDLVDLLDATARGRYEAGEGESAALLRLQLERTRLEERRADLEARRQVAVAELDRWLDRPAGAPLGTVRELPAVVLPREPVEELASHGAAEVAMADADRAVAAAELAMRRQDLRPDLMTGAGVAYRGSLDPMVMLRFGLTVPLWSASRQKPRIAAAEAELDAREHDVADARAMARAEAASMVTRFRTADEQIRLYRDGILPQSSATLDAARAAYLGGRGDLGSMVDAFRMWLEARAGLARREADRFVAWAGLVHLAHGVDEAHGTAEVPADPAPIPSPNSAPNPTPQGVTP